MQRTLTATRARAASLAAMFDAATRGDPAWVLDPPLVAALAASLHRLAADLADLEADPARPPRDQT